jgi:hypothetical protein
MIFIAFITKPMNTLAINNRKKISSSHSHQQDQQKQRTQLQGRRKGEPTNISPSLIMNPSDRWTVGTDEYKFRASSVIQKGGGDAVAALAAKGGASAGAGAGTGAGTGAGAGAKTGAAATPKAGAAATPKAGAAATPKAGSSSKSGAASKGGSKAGTSSTPRADASSSKSGATSSAMASKGGVTGASGTSGTSSKSGASSSSSSSSESGGMGKGGRIGKGGGMGDGMAMGAGAGAGMAMGAMAMAGSNDSPLYANGKLCNGHGELDQPKEDNDDEKTGKDKNKKKSSMFSLLQLATYKNDDERRKCECEHGWAGKACEQDLFNAARKCSPLDVSCAEKPPIPSPPCMGPAEDYPLDDPCADPRRKHTPYPPGNPPALDTLKPFQPPPKPLFDDASVGGEAGSEGGGETTAARGR